MTLAECGVRDDEESRLERIYDSYFGDPYYRRQAVEAAVAAYRVERRFEEQTEREGVDFNEICEAFDIDDAEIADEFCNTSD